MSTSSSNPLPFLISEIQLFPSKAKQFSFLLRTHLLLHWVAYVSIAFCCFLVSNNYRLAFNQTASLPQSVFIIHNNEPASKGDYVAFTVPPLAAKHFKNPSAILAKRIVGVPGDVVTVADRVVSVNGQPVGFAKERSLKGEQLDPIEPTTVPPGYSYVMGLHRDSLDSRYTIVGLVPDRSVVGRAYPLF